MPDFLPRPKLALQLHDVRLVHRGRHVRDGIRGLLDHAHDGALRDRDASAHGIQDRRYRGAKFQCAGWVPILPLHAERGQEDPG